MSKSKKITNSDVEIKKYKGQGSQKIKEFKSSAYSCYRCGKSKFSFAYLTKGKMDVTCTSCQMTVAGIDRDKPFGNPIGDIIICGIDGSVAKGSDKCSILITKFGDLKKTKEILNANSPIDGAAIKSTDRRPNQGDEVVVPYLCVATFNPLKCLDVMAELKAVGCDVMKLNATRAARNAQDSIVDNATKKMNDLKDKAAAEGRATRARLAAEKAVLDAEKAKLDAIKNQLVFDEKEVSIKVSASKRVGEEGDGSRFEDLL